MARKPKKDKEPEHWPCQYCGGKTEFMDSAEIFGLSQGMIYLCRPCDAYCHTKKNSVEPLGRVANKELRDAEAKAKAAFEILWRTKYRRGVKTARDDGYKWLSEQLNIHPDLCHLTMMTVKDLERVVELCQPYADRLM